MFLNDKVAIELLIVTASI